MNSIKIKNRFKFAEKLKFYQTYFRGVIQKMVLSSDPNKLRMLSNGAVTALERSCRDRTLIATHQDGFIYPGTKWCGPGNNFKLCTLNLTKTFSLYFLYITYVITLI